MKSIKAVMMIMLLFLALPFATAAEKYYMDFSKQGNQGVILREGDLVEFKLLDADHFMRLKEIAKDNTSIKFNLYPYKGVAQRIPFFSLDRKAFIDLNTDGHDDLMLDIFDIIDGEVTIIAIALPQPIGDPDFEIPTGQGMVVKDTGNKFQRTFFIIGLIIVGLLGIVAYRKSKDTELDEEKPKEEEKLQEDPLELNEEPEEEQ